jgi:acyl-CoA thioester hydrolase
VPARLVSSRETARMTAESAGVSSVDVRVRYAETDQMGVAHHANYLVWCEVGRTHHMEQLGVRYRDLEARGVRLPVVAAALRYRAAARYDDVLEVRCWVRNAGSRSVEFGNAIVRNEDGANLATATITLIAVDSRHATTRIPDDIRALMVPVPDPVRL